MNAQQTFNTWQVGDWVRLPGMSDDNSHVITRINGRTVDVYGTTGRTRKIAGAKVWESHYLLPAPPNPTLEALRPAMRAPDRKAVR